MFITNRTKERKQLNLSYSYAIDNLRNQYPPANGSGANGVWISVRPGPQLSCQLWLESELPLAVNVAITGSEPQASSFSLVVRETFSTNASAVLRDLPVTGW